MTCGLSHQLCDEDVLQIVKKANKTGQTISNMSANAQKLQAGGGNSIKETNEKIKKDAKKK